MNSTYKIGNQKLVSGLKNVTLMSCIPEIAIQSCDTGQRIHFFDSDN